MSEKQEIHFNKLDKLDEYRQQLGQDFPELAIRELNHIGSDWDHVALEVTGSKTKS